MCYEKMGMYSMWSVSYTHLDVYKRQSVSRTTQKQESEVPVPTSLYPPYYNPFPFPSLKQIYE